VTMTLGLQRPDTKAEVILGVDTPGLPHGGGREPSGQRSLGELSVPTTAKG
jgi:hypothetical protein